MGKMRRDGKKSQKQFQFNILNFNENHYYLFNVTKQKNLLLGIYDLNEIKLNQEEINFLKSEIDTCESIDIKIKKNCPLK
jgi:hypothetical protein